MERQQLLVDWNKTDRSYDLNTTLVELFEAQVERTPQNPAVVTDDRCLTYAELNNRANQLAHYLKTKGVGPETLVGLFMERSVEMVVGIYGTLKAGGAYVPLDPDYPPERVGFMLADTRVPVELTQAHLRAALPPVDAEIICLDDDWRAIATQPCVNPADGAGAQNLAYVIFTSGSTGRPKGVANEHRGIVNRLLWMQEQYGLKADDRVLQKTPFSFDVSVWEFFWPLQTGACLVVARPGGHRDSSYLVDAIIANRITTLHFVPSMLHIFLEEDRVAQCTSVRRVICSGEALSVETQKSFFARLDAELHNLYGPTEAAVDVTFWACQRQSVAAVVPIGFPVANTQMYVLDNRLQPLPVGCSGELHIGGVQVARGYLNRPELTAEKFIPDPFSRLPGARLYKTGDLARYRNDGSIEYLGRMDFQVKIRGFRVELGEIENRLAVIAGIGKCVVALREDRPGDQRLVAYFEPTGPHKVSGEDLRQLLRKQLPDYMVPRHFVQLKDIPLSSNGKVDRRALPPPQNEKTAAEGAVAPRNEPERRIAEIWAELLGYQQVGIFDSFFDLGGHSLMLPKMLRKLRQAFAADLSIVHLFQYPTIASLTEFLFPQKAVVPDFGKAREMAGRQLAALQRQKRLAAARSNSDV
jgi:amino acid adenylation domain-containing protein